MKIKIKNLRLRTIIGTNDWERTNRQDVIINIKMRIDGEKVAATDDIIDTVNYRELTKTIIREVEKSNFYLLEKLADFILKIIMEDTKVIKAKVEVDKPQALRFSDSVSVSISAKRKE